MSVATVAYTPQDTAASVCSDKNMDSSDKDTIASTIVACTNKDTNTDVEKTGSLDPLPPALSKAPDGGFGWLVVFGAFMIQLCCWGFNFSWGVYQQFYLQENTFPGATLTQLSWSGGISTASVFLTCPFQSSMVRRFGLRPIIAVGVLISACGMILASFATTLWQLYLTQGVLYGVGAGMALFTSVAVPVQWFDKKRGLAAGITVAGSGLGGACLSPLNRLIITQFGHRWALRIMGISVTVIVFSILFCVRTRIPLGRRGGAILDVSHFKDRGFIAIYFMVRDNAVYSITLAMGLQQQVVTFCIYQGMFVAFGYLVPVFLLPKFVTDLGMDPNVGATLVGVFAGVNAVSRIALGLVADKLGALNILILSSICTGLSCLIFWMTAKGLTMTVIFVIVYGFNAGGFNSLFPVVAADLMGLEKLAAAVGLLYSGNLFGNLLGIPIASALVTASGGSYTWAMVFAGIAPIIGAALLLPIRYGINPRIFVKV